MQIKARLRKLMIIGLLCCLLAIAPATSVWAQDDDAETTPEAPVAEVEAEEAESAEVDVEDAVEEADTEDGEEENAPPGVGILILLAGLGAIVVVGGATIAQQNQKKSA